MYHRFQVAGSVMQPDSIRTPALQPLSPPPIVSPRQARVLSAPSTSSQEHPAGLSVLTSQAPPLASLPKSSDSLPGDFMQQPEPPDSPLRHFLPKATKATSPALVTKASRRLSTQLHASTHEGRAVREDSAQQVLPAPLVLPHTCCTVSSLHHLCSNWFYCVTLPPNPPPTTPNTHGFVI